MAKRKRLSPANPEILGAAPETKSMMSRAPIADVASDAATTSALQDVTQELSEARSNGRMVLSLPVDIIALDHITRDRMMAEGAEMEALMSSIAERGQQTPIDIMETAPGQYGLISGWRRCQAIIRLAEAGRHDGHVLALLRQPAEASETYQAMVEENEIRVGLSYFERARIAAKAVEQGVFETEKAALLALFRTASRAKRSKIRSFLPLVAAFDGHLRFPHLIGERLGLRVSALLETHSAFAESLRTSLQTSAPDTPEAEQALLVKLADQVEKQSLKRLKSAPEVVCQNVTKELTAQWSADNTWLRLEGADMTPALREHILDQIHRFEAK